MAVYTHLPREVLRNFLSTYALGELEHFEGIKEGVENTNYRLVTSQGNFILTLFENRTSREDLPYFIALMRHIAAKDIPCPHPIADHAGEVIKTVAGKPAALFSELPGIAETAPDSEQCLAVGVLLAKFHRAGEDFKAHRENALSLAAWKTLIDKGGSKIDEVEPGLSSELRSELDFIEHHWPRHLPKGTIHADLFPDNVLWSNGVPSGMIDFYFSCADLLAYDLAVCINAWCFTNDHRINSNRALQMIAGYESIRPLNRAERDHLPILCRGAAMRFLATRLYDRFFADENVLVTKKDPVEYLRKNRFFRTHDELASHA